MKSDYARLIAEIDKVLETVRLCWKDATTQADKDKWGARINTLLDDRLRQMRLRDAAP